MTYVFTILFHLLSLLTSDVQLIEPRPFTVIATGDFAAERHSIRLVCYNKYYNQEMYPAAFLKDYKLDAINYKESMAIEIFMGDKPGRGHRLTLDKVEETAKEIEISFTFTPGAEIDSNITTRPFLIATTPKNTKKQVVFIENGVRGSNAVNGHIKN